MLPQKLEKLQAGSRDRSRSRLDKSGAFAKLRLRALLLEIIMARSKRKRLGKYIVADPEICHGKPTFRGTRIMVWQVLGQIADGMSWDKIVAEWRGTVSKEAVAEAVRLAQKTFVDHAKDYAEETQPA